VGYVLLLFLIYFLMIPVGPTISKSTGPTFAAFAAFSVFAELWILMVSLKLVFRLLKGRCHASKFLSIGLTLSFDVRLVGNNLAVIVDIALSRGNV